MRDLTRVELQWPAQNMVVADAEQYFAIERAGAVHLISSRCPHRGGPLHLGEVVDDRVRCPWHGNSFRLDRMCDRGVPTVQRGGRITAYLPSAASVELTHALVFAKGMSR
ncbi:MULTISPECIES: Rieske 2Fe-2S domain-containing protein [Micromonospora]|uniref:Rieske 2Fe-2S domain-containing protein n=1 Tax=Micromonospora TaxID=1873 RepID=UPI003400BBAC